MAAATGVPVRLAEQLMDQLAASAQGGQKQRLYGWLQEWADIEAQATVLRWYEPLVVPGLLQTEEYARAILSARPEGRRARQPADQRLWPAHGQPRRHPHGPPRPSSIWNATCGTCATPLARRSARTLPSAAAGCWTAEP